MNIPVLCIIQARMNSTRLPGKMLLKLGGETLIARAWRIACEAFGPDNCVVAIPSTDSTGPLGTELRQLNARSMHYLGEEADVLGRFFVTAATYRWHPDSVIVRYTPDDPWKKVTLLRRVAAGERVPVELGGEAFTFAQLREAHARLAQHALEREHLTPLFFDGCAEPQISDVMIARLSGVVTIDTQADYDAAVAQLASLNGGSC